MKKDEIEKINAFLRNNEGISKAGLLDFITAAFPDKKKQYARFYLADLLNSGVAYPVRTGLWRPANGKKVFSFVSDVDPALVETLRQVTPSCLLSVWSISSLNRLLLLQILHPISIVSSSWYCRDDVFSALFRSSYPALPLKAYYRLPEKSLPDRLVLVSTMNEDAPLFRGNKKMRPNSPESLVAFPKIEKVLVDCYCGDVPLDPAQTKELFANAIQGYFVNFSVLERYAKSRGKHEEICALLRGLNLWEAPYDRQ